MAMTKRAESVQKPRTQAEIRRARLADYFSRVLTWEAIGRRALEIYQEVLSRRQSLIRRSS